MMVIDSLDIWKSLAGIALFLLGMNFLESSVKKLAGRSFKLFLKKHTTNKVKAILGSALVTGALQSSSIVNLITLAFVGAGVITMQNALAVMLGANLGSTLSNWLVASVGFSSGIENFSLPVTGIAGIAAMLFNKDSKWHHWSNILLGIGLLFIGLGFIRTGIETFVTTIDLSALNKYNVLVFLFTGLIITSLVQSSSVTVAIVLSALYANAINLYMATAIVLGSEIGTTVKLVLAAADGSAIKKRVVAGNIIFNVVTVVLVLFILTPINSLITDIWGIRNTLIALVTFQSLVNVISIILFYPLLGIVNRFLEKRFTGNENETLFINKIGTTDVDIALDAMKEETKYLMYQVTGYCYEVFGINDKQWHKQALSNYIKHTHSDKYNHIKKIYGDIHAYYIQLQGNTETPAQAQQLEQLIFAVRNGMYAAKNIKDTIADVEQLSNSSNDIKFNFFLAAKEKTATLFEKVLSILDNPPKAGFEELTKLYNGVQENYTITLKSLYENQYSHKISDIEISTLINFNRELYSSFKAIVMALKDYTLNEQDAAYFDGLPGFIR